jgi:hypothetical protein
MLPKTALFFMIFPAFAAENTALVAALTGTVTVNKTNPVSAFEWLPGGAVLQTGSKSSATVILLNGHRFELGPSARATIGATGLAATAGPVRELDPVPPIPKSVPLATATSTAAVAGFRGLDPEAGSVSPPNGTAALPGAVSLTYHHVDSATAYQFVVEDANGNEIAHEQTRSPELTVQLQPGVHYTWTVRALGAGGVMAENQLEFVTLSNSQMQTRQAFADAVRDLPDGLALLASVDFASGLVREALDEFRAALKLKPGDLAVQRGLAKVESALSGK